MGMWDLSIMPLVLLHHCGQQSHRIAILIIVVIGLPVIRYDDQ